MGKLFVGISGWTFPGWRNNFYPKGLAQKKELQYAAEKLNTIEINGTFYSLQKPDSFKSWYAQTPSEFQYSVKGGQYITHVRRLKEFEGPLAYFFASGVLELKEKLGCILWQFPPNMMWKDNRFERFLDALPKNFGEAKNYISKYKDRLRYPEQMEIDFEKSIRHAFELRHKTFFTDKFYKLLEKHNVAIVQAHAGGKSPYTDAITTDFTYMRMHGEGDEYKKGYPEKELKVWAKRLKAMTTSKSPTAPKEIFCYFNCEAKEYAPQSALTLSKLMSPPVRKKKAA